MNVSIVGAGYVGLVTGVGFANKGHKVICIDTDMDKVKQINWGKSPVYEDNLERLLSRSVNEIGNLEASSNYSKIQKSDITFVCVNTPCNSKKDIDLSQIVDSAAEIGRVLAKTNNHHVVTVKSTVVPGTTEDIVVPALEKYSSKKAGRDFDIAVNPEFLQEGKAMQCFLNPGRIVIGEYDHRADDKLQEIYHDFLAPILRTDIRTAEMIKYASNAFLATKITFINEIGNICKELGIDVYEVAKGMGYDPRIGDKFLNAGIGFGGSCLPKDSEALICQARELNYEAKLLQAVSEVNKEQPLRLIEIARKRLGSLENRVVAVLGLAFKPDTDDIRQAPALTIIGQLLMERAAVKVYDPKVMPKAEQIFSDGVEFCNSASDATAEADCVLIATEWDEFKDESLYTGKLVIDGRRTLNPEKARRLCQYEGVCW